MKQKNTEFSPFRPFDTRRYFDYIVPYSLEECAKRLANRNERGTGWLASRQAIQITVSQSKHDRCEFRVNKDAGKNLQADAYGELHYLDTNRTQVNGYAKVSSMSLTIMILFVFTHVIFVGLIAQFVPFAVFSMLILIFFARVLTNTRNELIDAVEEAVLPEGKFKVKRQAA